MVTSCRAVHLLEDGGHVTEDGGIEECCNRDGHNVTWRDTMLHEGTMLHGGTQCYMDGHYYMVGHNVT